MIPEPRGVSVKEVVLPFARFPGSDPGTRAGDALDRRGHGDRTRLRDDLRQGDARGGSAPAGAAERPRRRRVPLGLRPRQTGRDAARPAPRRSRLRPRGDPGHRPPHHAARHRGDGSREGRGGGRQFRRRPGPRRQGRPDRLHAGRPRRAHRRLPDPPGRDSAQGPVHHDPRRGERGGAGDRPRLGGRAEEPAGATPTPPPPP